MSSNVIEVRPGDILVLPVLYGHTRGFPLTVEGTAEQVQEMTGASLVVVCSASAPYVIRRADPADASRDLDEIARRAVELARRDGNNPYGSPNTTLAELQRQLGHPITPATRGDDPDLGIPVGPDEPG